MTRVDRRRFESDFSSRRLQMARISPQVMRRLEAHGVSRTRLQRIAGDDHVISGAEFNQLYEALAVRERNGQRVDTEVSEDLFRELMARAERVMDPRPADAALPTGSARARTTGIGGASRGAARPTTPADEPTPDPAAAATAEPPALPTAYDRRTRRIGRDRVETHTAPDANAMRDARAIAALPPSEERGDVPVRAYLEAASARDERARLTASGDRRGAQRIGRPDDVPARVWNMAGALDRRGISASDTAHYIATGQLPDLLNEDGEVVQTGEQRMQALRDAAVRRGSWTAVNTLTFLVSARRSGMAAERRAAQAHLDTLPADDPQRAQLTAAIEANQQFGRDLRTDLNRIYQAATAARERNGAAAVRRGEQLTRDAAAARASGDTARATELDGQAQAARNRGARILHSEAQYRAAMPAYRAESGRLYRMAAGAQIGTGEAQIRALVRGGAPLPETPPAVLGDGDGSTTGNGVPGAGRLLGTARTVDPNAGADDSQLALEGRRSRAVAGFHRTHLERGGYFTRDTTHGPVPPRTESLLAHRRAYLGARVDQANAATSRLAVARSAPPSAERDMRIASVEAERRGIAEEFSTVLGQSMASDRRASADAARVRGLTEDLTSARSDLTEARRAAGQAEGEFTTAVDVDDAVFGDALKTSGEARRDDNNVSDGRAMRDIEAGRVRVTRGRVTATRDALGEARSAQRASDARAMRDRQDAELVVGAMTDFPNDSGAALPPPASIREGYDRTRAVADSAARGERIALAGAEAQLPYVDGIDHARLRIADRRVDLSRYYSRSAEGQVTALGEEGREGATARLDAAAELLGHADVTRRATPRDSDERIRLATGIVTARTELATANADYRPGETRDQLAAAEETTNTDLLPTRPDLAGEAYLRIGSAATTGLARIDQRLLTIARSGNHDRQASDALYRQAHRMFDRPEPGTESTDLANGTNRGDLIPAGRAADDARALLGRFDRAIETVDRMLGSSGRQIELGRRYARARTRSLGYAEIQAAQAQVSTVISGGAWLLSFGQFDMKEDMAEAGEGATAHRLSWINQDAERMQAGRTDMQTSWDAARRDGRAFEWMQSVRIFSDRSHRDTMPQAYTDAFFMIGGGMSEDRARRGDWQDFNRAAVREGRVAAASGLRGPILGYEAAHEALGDERIMALTSSMMDAIESQGDSLRETTDGMMGIIVVNTGLEVALGIVLTAGIGSGAAVAEGANAANAARTGAQALNTARNATIALRALSVARTAGTVTVVGGGMMAANWAVGELAGRNTGFARGFETLTNFIPIGAGQRAAGIGNAAAHADDAATAATRLQRLRAAMSWSHVRELSAWGRALTPAVLGGVQASATTAATPWIAQRVGLERSELGQAAIGLGLNVIFAGGMAAAVRPRTASAAMAEHLVRTASPDGQLPRRVQGQVRADIEAFARRTEGRLPTDAEIGQLRTQLYDRLGLADASPDVGDRRAMVDGAIEAMRIDRALSLGVREAGEGNPTRALQLAADRLHASRGGEGSSSRLQAYRDVAMVMSERLGADAQTAFRGGDAARGDALMRQRAEIGDRATAAEVVESVVRATPEDASTIRSAAQRRRVESIVADELGGARQRVDGTDGEALGRTDYDRMAQRLVDEGGVTREEAATLVDGLRREVVEQGVVRHLAAAQAEAGGRPLTNGEIREGATNLARRAGLSDPDGFASSIVSQRAQLERTGVVRPASHGPAATTPPDPAVVTRQATEAAAAEPTIARFIQAHGEPARQLVGMLGRDAFMRAFADEGVVSFEAHRLLDLPPERVRELANLAQQDPARVRALLDGFGTLSNRETLMRAARDVGIERAAQLADIARESPNGFGYLAAMDGGPTRMIEALRADPAGLRQTARTMQQRVFMRASDGTYLLRGDPPGDAPMPSRSEMEGLARRAGVDPAVLADPAAHPAEMARVIQQMRSELSPQARTALDREISGRRFVDEVHFEEARQAGVTNPEHRYGRVDFEAWQRADSILMRAAEAGEPLTIDILQRAHAAASEGIVRESQRGVLRSGPRDTAYQGGEGPMNIQEVTADEFVAMRDNPHLNVHDLGATESGGRRIAVEYTEPAQVRAQLDAMLQRMEQRIAAGEDPVLVAADAQREFVSIHPFHDGNGRMSRLVMDYALRRAGLEPSVVRDPNLDTNVSQAAWRTEVRRGLMRPFEATQRAWAAARRGIEPPSGSDAAPPRTPAPPASDRFARRDTLGWTGEPTARPPAGAEHLGVIHAGLDAMPPRVRDRINLLLGRAEDAAPRLVAEGHRLATRQQEIWNQHGQLLSRPEQQLSTAERARAQELRSELGRIQERLTEVDRGIESSRRQARQMAVAEMERFRRSLMRGVEEPAARTRADAIDVRASALALASEGDLRGWSAEFFRLVGRDFEPHGLALAHNGSRANAGRNGVLNVGDNPTREIVFHELGHYLEYSDPAVARAARQWVIARSQFANGGREAIRPMRDLTGSDFYGASERAFEDHFENPYVGRDYGADPATEVISVGMEYFTSADRMLQLYQRDPEHFMFMLGVLSR